MGHPDIRTSGKVTLMCVQPGQTADQRGQHSAPPQDCKMPCLCFQCSQPVPSLLPLGLTSSHLQLFCDLKCEAEWTLHRGYTFTLGMAPPMAEPCSYRGTHHMSTLTTPASLAFCEPDFQRLAWPQGPRAAQRCTSRGQISFWGWGVSFPPQHPSCSLWYQLM